MGSHRAASPLHCLVALECPASCSVHWTEQEAEAYGQELHS
jgi:hypothetical protein